MQRSTHNNAYNHHRIDSIDAQPLYYISSLSLSQLAQATQQPFWRTYQRATSKHPHARMLRVRRRRMRTHAVLSCIVHAVVTSLEHLPRVERSDIIRSIIACLVSGDALRPEDLNRRAAADRRVESPREGAARQPLAVTRVAARQ